MNDHLSRESLSKGYHILYNAKDYHTPDSKFLTAEPSSWPAASAFISLPFCLRLIFLSRFLRVRFSASASLDASAIAARFRNCTRRFLPGCLCDLAAVILPCWSTMYTLFGSFVCCRFSGITRHGIWQPGFKERASQRSTRGIVEIVRLTQLFDACANTVLPSTATSLNSALLL